MYYSVDFSENIKTLRKARGLSQQKLAEKADISETWVREIEHGCANVTRDIVDRIAKALDVSVLVLYGLQMDPDAVWNEQHEIQAMLGRGGKAVLA